MVPLPPLIESLNALPLPAYRAKLCPPSLLALPTSYSSTDPTLAAFSYPKLNLTLESPITISPTDLQSSFALIVSTSATAYAASSIGWSPSRKKKEMRLPDLRYVLLKETTGASPCSGAEAEKEGGEKQGNDEEKPDGNDDEGRRLEGFVSFMLTYEDGYEVIYCYEIHLSSSLQGRGIGAHMMGILEAIGRRAGVQKVMLTVLAANEGARRFYERVGYEEDEYSPGPRILRSGVVKEPDYAILSKPLTEEVKRVDRVGRGKKRRKMSQTDGNGR